MFSKLTNMSKRSEEFANKAYPNYSPDGKTQVDMSSYRFACERGYEQAEKDTIERVCKWLEENVTYIHPRKGIKTCIINLNALREAMEEEL